MSVLLTTYYGDRNLATGDVVLNYVMETAADVRLNLWVGTDDKPCVALAGEWELRVWVRRSGAINTHYMQPSPQTMAGSANLRVLFVSKVFDVNVGDRLTVNLKSPNGGDNDVYVYTELIHVTGALPAVVPNAVGGLPVLDANSLVNVDVERLGGVVQSLTDLKHFADSGYDPDTSKVNGVKLVDTTTTNTDMLTAADVADAVWNETAITHTGAGTAGQQLWTDIDAILVDTAAMPTAADIADAVWDEAIAGHAAAGSTGEALADTLADVEADEGFSTETTHFGVD